MQLEEKLLMFKTLVVDIGFKEKKLVFRLHLKPNMRSCALLIEGHHIPG